MKNESLADKVFGQLEADILGGKYSAGETVTEIELSNKFQVSRTPIREAIRRLEQESLVSESGKGIKILGISSKDLSDIYDIRMRIEGLAARFAAEHITDDELEKLSEIIELQEFYTSKQKMNYVKDADSNFHDIIYHSCNSTTLTDILGSLHRKIQMQRKASLENKSRARDAVNEHKEIYEALKKRDPDLAEKLTVQHIKNAKENLTNILSMHN